MNNKRWKVGSFGVLQVVGHEPEMADMSNPSGEIIREVVAIELVDDKGYRLIGPIIGETPDADTISNVVLNVESQLRGGLDPDQSTEYRPGTPVYGSTAYVESDAEADLVAWEQEQRSCPF